MLLEKMSECNRCSLRPGCNQVVAGVGPASASLFILNQEAGIDDDILGEPFTGVNGQLLDKMLKAANIDKEKTYRTNMIKCKPNKIIFGDNHINICKYWLWEEIKIIQPKVILTFGEHSAHLLLKLKPSTKMKDVVGKLYDVPYTAAKIAPWYHLSYLMNRGAKQEKETVEFLIKIKELI